MRPRRSTHRLAHGVEHAVDDPRVALLEERVGDVEVFADDRAGRDVGPGDQLVGAGAQDLQHGLVEPLEPPVAGQPRGELGVDLFLAGDDAADHVVEELDLGAHVLLVLDLVAEAVLVELVEQPGERGALHLPLVQRLDRGEAGGGAAARAGRGLAHLRRSSTDLACAGRPSTLASVIAAGPILPSASRPIAMKLVRFMKSSTESPLAKRARRPVGSTWLGPAT